MNIFVNDKPRYWCWSWIFFIKDSFFQEACKQHDIDYARKTISRRAADYKFLRNMLWLAWTNKKYIILAYIFYWIVRIVGGLFYNNIV